MDCCLTTGELHQLLLEHGVTNLGQVELPPPEGYSQQQGIGSEQQGAPMEQQGLPNEQQGLSSLQQGTPGAAAQQQQQQQQGTVGPGVWPEGPEAGLWGLPGGSGGYMEFVFR